MCEAVQMVPRGAGIGGFAELIRPPGPLRHPALVRAVAIELAPRPRCTVINAERLWNVYEG